jgi:hypothetical protein
VPYVCVCVRARVHVCVCTFVCTYQQPFISVRNTFRLLVEAQENPEAAANMGADELMRKHGVERVGNPAGFEGTPVTLELTRSETEERMHEEFDDKGRVKSRTVVKQTLTETRRIVVQGSQVAGSTEAPADALMALDGEEGAS